MKLTWRGTAALLLSAENTLLAFDPFLGIPAGEAHPDRTSLPCAEVFREARYVFVTHGHFDHILQIPALCGPGESVIYATKTPCATLEKNGFPKARLHLISPGMTIGAGAFTVRAFQGRHCRFDAPLILGMIRSSRVWKNLSHMLRLLRWNSLFLENGETLFYELTACGKRVQIMGSMGLDPAVEYPTGADALILPYQGRSDLPVWGASLVARLKPKRVYLDHYDDSFPPMTSRVDTAPFEALLAQRYGIPCRPLRLNETIDI